VDVYQRYKQQLSVGVPVSGVELQGAGERFAQSLGELDFIARTGWILDSVIGMTL
jgi:hypothetical protein